MRHVLFALLVSLVPTLSAVADEAWVPDWKMIAGDGSVLPSDCIGNTETLDCFIDTLAACSAWSEGPEWRADDTYFDAPICAAVPSFAGLAVLSQFGPTSTQLYLYSVGRWQLSNPNEWTPDLAAHELAQAGDTVLDVYTLTCSPDPGCLASLENYSSATVILGHCPRVACFGLHVPEPSATGLASPYPFISLLVRRVAAGWAVIDWYGPPAIAPGAKLWDHWKRK